MATGTAGSTALRTHGLMVHTMMGQITFASPGTTVAKTIGVLPAGAMVVGGGAYVTTAFNDSGTDVIDVGTSGDADGYATLLDVSSVGYKVLDELATSDDFSASEVTVTATYTGQNANGTTGVANIIINFVIPSNYGL